MKAAFFILSVFLLAACSDLDPRYPTTDEDSEETVELREKYTDKVTGKWYLKQEPQEYYFKQFERLYYISLEQYYEFHENGEITGRVIMKAKRADGSPSATGGEWFSSDYRLNGSWGLIHRSIRRHRPAQIRSASQSGRYRRHPHAASLQQHQYPSVPC